MRSIAISKAVLLSALWLGLAAVPQSASAGTPAVRQGDSTSHGGTILVGSPSVVIEGAPAGLRDSFVTCPIPLHNGGTITSGTSTTVFVNGQPATRSGAIVAETGSLSTLIGGATNVLIGD